MEDLILTGGTMTPAQRKEAAKIIALANQSVSVKVSGALQPDYGEEDTGVYAGLDGVQNLRTYEGISDTGKPYSNTYGTVAFMDERGKPTKYDDLEAKNVKIVNLDKHVPGSLYKVFKYPTGKVDGKGNPIANLKLVVA